jgi:hypothetical protein
MKPSYQIVDVKDSQGYAKYLAKNGQLLLPLVELPEASRLASMSLSTSCAGPASRTFYSYRQPAWPAKSLRFFLRHLFFYH